MKLSFVISEVNQLLWGYFKIIRLHLPSKWAFTWRSIEEGDEGLYWPNSKTHLVIILHIFVILKFNNHITFHCGQYEPLSPSTERAP